MPGGTIVVCLLFICILPEDNAPTVVNSFARECRTYTISKSDTPQTQRNIARENARCREAREQKK